MHPSKMWKINKREKAFNCKIYNIEKLDCFLPSKNVKNDFFSINICNWVNIFALTDDDKVVLVKQHRLGKNIVTYEVPAGGIDKDEEAEIGALRELEEETGFTPEKLILMKKISVNPAIQNNDCYFYLALGCKKTKEVDFDDTEELEVVLIEKDELFKSLFNDLIDNSLALMSVMFAKEYLASSH
ncbi:MAG TPA: NUDIX hydrolase [Spirochaetota bacterium]|nr:NUDIX hydrolase [Spirochaetota bacterium]